MIWKPRRTPQRAQIEADYPHERLVALVKAHGVES